MNILDENIIDNQRRQLNSWRIRVRQIGYEVGHVSHVGLSIWHPHAQKEELLDWDN